MINRLAVFALLFAACRVDARCPQYHPTLIELQVLTCNSISVEASSKGGVIWAERDAEIASYSGTLFTGDILSKRVVAKASDGVGEELASEDLEHHRQYIGRQYFVVSGPSKLSCPQRYPARVHFLAYPGGCTEGRDGQDLWEGRFPFRSVFIESHPEQWVSVPQ